MPFLKRNLLFFIVFITGAAVLIIEVTATRILAPYFGNTLFTISSILGIVLGALSLGYYIGGILADKYPRFSVFFFLILIAGAFCLLMQGLSKTALAALGSALDMKVGPPVASLVLFFTPSLILGMMSPFAIKLKSIELKEIGKVSGSVFFWSTLGSIAGSFLAGFVLIPRWGISTIIISTSLVLVAIGLLGIWFFRENKNDKNDKKRLKQPKTVLIPILISIFVLSAFLFSLISVFMPKPERIIFEKEGLYNEISVMERLVGGKQIRVLLLDRLFHSAIFTYSDELPLAYSKYYVLYKVVNPQIEKALFLGGGGYTLPRRLLLDQNNIKRVDVVEIEPELFQIAKKYFRLPEDKRLFSHITDGRRFLRESKQKYDMIFADVFYSYCSIPVHFATKEFFALVKSRLSKEGFFIINVAGTLEKDGERNLFLLSAVKTFKSVFKNYQIFVVGVRNSRGVQNFMLLGFYNDSQKIDFESKQVLENENKTICNLPKHLVRFEDQDLDSGLILTDDFAPVEYLTAKLF